jgi:Flp pilus assembly protein TadB
MRLYSRRSELVQKHELAMLFVFALVLECLVGIFTTGWLLDAAAVVGLAIAMVVPWVLHRRRSKAAESPSSKRLHHPVG